MVAARFYQALYNQLSRLAKMIYNVSPECLQDRSVCVPRLPFLPAVTPGPLHCTMYADLRISLLPPMLSQR